MTSSLTRQNLGFDFESPVYRFGPLETTASNVLCVPIIYGQIKAAGNKIWQGTGVTQFSALVAFCEGQISEISNIELNGYYISSLPGCSSDSYLGDGIQNINSRVPGNTLADKAALVGGLKYTAYVALTVAASTKVTNNFMNVTANIKGKLVKVYTDTSTYTTKYSNNPAWCILDFLTSASGCNRPIDSLYIQSFINAAQYCDVKINPVNSTGTVSCTTGYNTVTGYNTKFTSEVKIGDQITISGIDKIVTAIASNTSLTVDSNFSTSLNTQAMVIKDTRFTLNLILDERKSRQDWLNEMLITCRGNLVYNAQHKLSLVIEQETASVQEFTPKDIINGSEYFWTTPKDQHCDILRMRYIYPTEQCARVFAIAESYTFLNDPPIIQEIEAFGITNFKQASRLAWFYLNQANNCNKFISFRTTQIALDRMVGDVITFTSSFLGYIKKKMRIVQIAEAQNGQIQIVCREHNGAQSATLLTNLAGNNNDLLFTSVAEDASANNITIKYTNPSANNQPLSVSVSGQDINVSLATNSTGAITSTAAQIITAIQNNSAATTLVNVAVAPINGNSDGSGVVTAMAKTNLSGGASSWLYSDTLGSVEPVLNLVSINNALFLPSDVPSFSSRQDYDTISFKWEKISDPDVTYEIREGVSWTESQLIAEKLTGQSYTLMKIQRGLHHYWIAAGNKYGIYSANPLLSTIEIDDIPLSNLVLCEDIINTDIPPSNLNNSFVSQGKVILDSNAYWSTTGTWSNTDMYYMKKDDKQNRIWGTDCVDTGSYTTGIYNLKADIKNSDVSVEYNLSSSSNIVIQWQYSDLDNLVNNNIWTDFVQGTYSFEYYRFKITLNSPNNKFTALSMFKIHVDVPDRDIPLNNQVITDANAGLLITFDTPFTDTPAIVANIVDGTIGYCVISEKDKFHAVIKAYRDPQTAITAKVDVNIKGY